MINHINKNIDIKALENRLAEEVEEKLEFGCYLINVCGDAVCVGVNGCVANVQAGNTYPTSHC